MLISLVHTITCEEKSKVGGEGWSGRGEEGESQGLQFTPTPTHTLGWPCLLPPLPRGPTSHRLCDLGMGEGQGRQREE